MGDKTELEILISGRDEASGVLGRVGGALGQLGSAATRLGSDLLPISVASGVVAGSALAMAADYEQSMNILQAQSGATNEQMAAMDKQAIALGADMTLPGTSAADAAEAMLELSKAGLSVTNTMDAAQGVLQMSAAGQIENAEAATITANALNTFGLAGSDATMVADLLAAAANASSADVRGMADSLQMSGSVAAMTGQSIGDTTTAIALMANAGIQGSDAGTSLKQMLLSLSAPTDKAADLINALGISLYDANGEMLPMPELIDQFGGALDGMSQQQRNAALATIFGSDAVRAANTVLLRGREAWDQMSTAVNRSGAAQDMAAAQTAGFKGALDGLRSTVETVLLEAARPLLAILTPMVRGFADLIGQVSAANPQLFTAGIAVAGVLAVAAPLALGIGMVATALGALLGPVGLVIIGVGLLAAAWATNFGNIQGYVNTLISVFQAWHTSTGTVIGGILGMLGAVTFWVPAFKPVLAIIQDVVALVQTTLPMALENLQITWGVTWGVISSVVMTALTSIGPIIATITQWIGRDLPLTISSLTVMWNLAWLTIGDVVTTVLPIILGFVQAVVGAFTASWPQIIAIVETVFNTLRTTISMIVAVVGPIIASFVQGAVEVFAVVWPQILSTVREVLNGVQVVVFSVLYVVQVFMATHGDEIRGFITTAWTAIQEIVQTALAIIQGTIVPALQAIAGFIEAHGTEIQAVLDAAWAAIKGIVEGALTIIKGILKAILQAIHGDWQGAWETLKTTGATLWEGIKETVTRIAEKLGPILANIWENIKTAAVEKWAATKEAAATAWENVKAAIAQKIDEALTAVLQWLDNTLVKIESFDLQAAAKQFFGTILPGIAAKVTEALASVGEWLTDVWTKISGFDLQGAAKASFGTVVAGIIAKAADIATEVGRFLTNAYNKIVGYEFKSATLTAIQTVVAGIIAKAIDVLKEIGLMLTNISTKISGFSLLDVGSALIQGMIDGIAAMAGALVAKAVGVVQGAIDAAKALLGIKSPSTVFIAIGQEMVAGLIAGFDEAQVEAARKIAEGVSSIIVAAVTAADAINNFTPVDNLGVITAQIMEFLVGVETQFQALVDQVDQELAEKAQALAEAIGPVVDLVGGAVETLGSLGEMDLVDGNAMTAALDQVGWMLGVIVVKITEWTSGISDDLQAAARSFAENAQPAVDLVVGGIEVLAGLGSAKLFDGAIITAALDQIGWMLAVLVAKVGEWGGLVSEELQTAARTFAENAGPVIGLIKPAVDGLASLADYTAVDRATLDQLSSDIEYIVGKIVTAGATVTEEALAGARRFAEVATTVGAMLKAGAEGLVGESGVQFYHEVSHETIDLFVSDMAYVVSQLITTAAAFTGEGLTTAVNLAEAMKKVGDALAKGVAGLIKPQGADGVTISDYTGIAHEIFDTFIADAAYLVDIVEEAASAFTMKGLTQAQAFAEAGQAIYKALSAGIKAGAGIGDSDVSGLALAMDQLTTAVVNATNAVLEQFSELVNAAYDAGYGWATNLADGITGGLSYLEAALAAVAELFPHSPAKAGPLREQPDWNAWMLPGLDAAAATVGERLSGIGGQVGVSAVGAVATERNAGLANAGQGQEIHIHMHDAVIRDELDIVRIAEAVGQVLGGQALVNRRLATVW